MNQIKLLDPVSHVMVLEYDGVEITEEREREREREIAHITMNLTINNVIHIFGLPKKTQGKQRQTIAHSLIL